MKERPILMSAPMVLACLNDTKTQTRRIVKPGPPPCQTNADAMYPYLHGWRYTGVDYACERDLERCPYGDLGGRLWVRETFGYDCMAGADECTHVDCVHYRADISDPKAVESWKGHWKPSIFMPRVASRLTLEITDVRVERLQDISEADALAEGCTAEAFREWAIAEARKHKTEDLYWIETPNGSSEEDYCNTCAHLKLEELKGKYGEVDDLFLAGGYGSYESDGARFCETCGVELEVCLTDYAAGEEIEHFKNHSADGPSGAYALITLARAVATNEDIKAFAKIAYRWLWDSINGGGAWDKNPWVWAVSFKRVQA